jgi:6-phosphogluconolactonase
MSPQPTAEIAVSADEQHLARAVAERLVGVLNRIQTEGRVPSVVLTGGSIADQVHRAVLDVPEHAEVDWAQVDVWFGDERFVRSDDSDRNALHAREAFLSVLPVDPARVHEMPASDGRHGDDVDAAAAAYAAEIGRVLGDEPRFDVLMLGIGPDGHCASLFPGHEALQAQGTVVGVRRSPKPPPTRISLTMGMLRRADEVWFIASGEEKAQAVHDAFNGRDVETVPASGPKGRERTLWLLDAEAAGKLRPAAD